MKNLKTNRIFTSGVFTILAVLVVSNLVWAISIPQSSLGITGQEPPQGNSINIQNILDSIASWGFGLLISLASVLVLVAAYFYLTAGGNPDSVKTAKNLIIYALVAIAVAFASKGLVALLGYFLNGGGTNSNPYTDCNSKTGGYCPF